LDYVYCGAKLNTNSTPGAVIVPDTVEVCTRPMESAPEATDTLGMKVFCAKEAELTVSAVEPVVVVVPDTINGFTPAGGAVGVAVTKAAILQRNVASGIGQFSVVVAATT